MEGNSKIRITREEIAQLDVVPEEFLPPPQEQVQPKGRRVWMGAIVFLVLFILALGITSLAVLKQKRSQATQQEFSVEKYSQQQIAVINLALQDKSSSLFAQLSERIENAHVTITVASGKVTKFNVSTYDGTNNACINATNIDEVDLQITFLWSGLLDKGHTVLRLVYDRRTQNTIRSEIVETSAMINTEDRDFWYGVGKLIGALFII